MTDQYTSTAGIRIGAYGVHLLTAAGVACAFFAIAETCAPTPNPKIVFAWLGLQVLIDAIDGPLARAFHVKKAVPEIDGRKIDDIVDYLTYTFVPLTLVWRMDWLPGADAIWVVPAMVASLFGFSNAGAKDEAEGFFLGFPSYWNILAVYICAWHWLVGPWPGAILIAICTILTVLPVRFLYPNLAPHPWRGPMLIGAAIWAGLLVWIILRLPHPPAWLIGVSLIYPVFYTLLSVVLDLRQRRLRKNFASA